MNRYYEKFSNDISTLNNQLYYTPKINNYKNNEIAMTMLVVRPQDREKILDSIYNDIKLGLGVGINQFFIRCRVYI